MGMMMMTTAWASFLGAEANANAKVEEGAFKAWANGIIESGAVNGIAADAIKGIVEKGAFTASASGHVHAVGMEKGAVHAVGMETGAVASGAVSILSNLDLNGVLAVAC